MRTVSTIVCVSVEVEFTISISEEGNVYTCGYHPRGGNGMDHRRIKSPSIVPNLRNIKSVSCGYFHTACLDRDGIVYTFGCNNNNQLGRDNWVLKSTNQPQILDLPKIKQVCCGNSFTSCVSEEGDLYSFGGNTYGELGFGDVRIVKGRCKSDVIKNIDFMECGGQYAIYKLMDGSVVGCGLNYFGELGTESRSSRITPYQYTNLPDDIIDIKCGKNHSLILTSKNQVLSCGYNKNGQLGRETGDEDYSVFWKLIENLDEIIRIECGENHTICIDNYDNIYVFGEIAVVN